MGEQWGINALSMRQLCVNHLSITKQQADHEWVIIAADGVNIFTWKQLI